MSTTARVVTLVVAVLLTGGCASPRPGAQAPGEQPDDVPFELCSEASLLTADPSVYRDEPHYGPHEQPIELIEDAIAWAREQGSFEEAWFDHDHLGWIHLGFTGDADTVALQAAVEQEFPGAGIAVVPLPFTTAELVALADRAREAVLAVGGTIGGSSASAPSGGCTDDANPHAFVVALERSMLPAPPFDIQLDADDPPPGAPEERTRVEVDLRAPGEGL